MGKGSTVRANLRVTRAQINNASSSAQARAFKARQIAKQKRDSEERKLRTMQAAAAKEANPAPDATEETTTAPDAPAKPRPEE
jgi:hypothetical protein